MMLLYSNKCVPLHCPMTNDMPRRIRKISGTGIYHVMLRGINRQDIFEDDEDYLQMIGLLHNKSITKVPLLYDSFELISQTTF